VALKLYSYPDGDYSYTDIVPFTVTVDGRVGGTIDQRVYLRNDHAYRWYSNITIQAVDTDGKDMVSGTVPGFYWKLAEGDNSLCLEEWELVAQGNTLTLSQEIGSETAGDIVTYVPIWVRTSIPKGIPIQTIKDIYLRISATENYIPHG
jgi:hypothetical protein